MSIKPPTNMLYANTVSRHPSVHQSARSRRVRARVSSRRRKIGIFDINARAGLLFDALDFLSRRQSSYTFYPVEARIPTGLGHIDETVLRDYALSSEEQDEVKDNVLIDDFFPLLRETRADVGVDHLVAFVRQPLASIGNTRGGSGLIWNYFSIGYGTEIVISVSDVREFARKANRPFEAAVTMMALAAIWTSQFGLKYHEETRSCPMDFNRDREGLIQSIRKMELCSHCQARLSPDELDDANTCLDLLRDYKR